METWGLAKASAPRRSGDEDIKLTLPLLPMEQWQWMGGRSSGHGHRSWCDCYYSCCSINWIAAAHTTPVPTKKWQRYLMIAGLFLTCFSLLNNDPIPPDSGPQWWWYCLLPQAIFFSFLFLGEPRGGWEQMEEIKWMRAKFYLSRVWVVVRFWKHFCWDNISIIWCKIDWKC